MTNSFFNTYKYNHLFKKKRKCGASQKIQISQISFVLLCFLFFYKGQIASQVTVAYIRDGFGFGALALFRDWLATAQTLRL